MTDKPLVFIASGTRGDVQPYLALAGAVRAAGQPVVIATHANLQGMVLAAGLPYRALAANPTDLSMQDGSAALRMDANPISMFRDNARFVRRAQPLLGELLRTAHKACADACGIVTGLPAMWAADVAEARGLPIHWAFLQPITRTRAWSSAILPARMPGLLFAASHRLIEALTWLPWRTTVNTWRQTFGLSLRHTSWLAAAQLAPVHYGFSPLLVPAPADWPAHHLARGEWRSHTASVTLPPHVEEFLAKGDDVVYIGFGSPGTRKTSPHVMIEDALMTTGLRAIIGGLEPAGVQSPLACHVRHVSHDALFPHMRVVVHHGGAGTTAAALRAGVPQIIFPAAVDQFFWSSRVSALGFGPKSVPQSALNANILARLLRATRESPIYVERSQTMATEMAGEDGLSTTAKALIGAA